jgi:hypothetical protein
MHSYFAYGLRIHSDIALPELEPGEAAADAFVRLGKVNGIPPDALTRDYYSKLSVDQVQFFWKEAGKFLIKDGREILIEPEPGVEERVLRLFILGPALALLLYQRGLLILHSSAIAVNDGAIAFLGEAGGGKSTTAAAFHKRGYRVVADDVVAVRLDAEPPIVFPSFPRLKIWPETATFLGDDLASLAELHPTMAKRGRQVAEAFSKNPLPLRRIYVLAEGQIPEIEILPPHATVIELVRHSYGVRLLQSLDASSHFLQCADLARRIPVRRLKRPYTLESLPGTIRAVEEDLAHL